MSKPKPKKNVYEAIISICAHRVSFWYDIGNLRNIGDKIKERLIKEAEDRSLHCITEGYASGELCCCVVDKEYRGWWKIED